MTATERDPWVSSLVSDPEISDLFGAATDLKRFLRIEAAWTRARGFVEDADAAEDVASAIEAAQPDPKILRDGFAADGVPIPALVKALRQLVDPEAAHLVHIGLTSQDVIDTSLALTLGQILEILTHRLRVLDTALARLSTAQGAGQIMGYTRMQPALEVPVAEIIHRWRQPIGPLLDDVARAMTGISIIQWGGPVGLRDHAQAPALGADFARRLRLTDPGQSWHTDRTPVLSVMQGLGRMNVITGKIGEDLALMSAIGPDQVVLRGGGSSAMPHKVNPVKAEMLITLADRAALLQAGALRSARHETLRSGRAWMLEWLSLQEASSVAGRGLYLADHLVTDIERLGVSSSR